MCLHDVNRTHQKLADHLQCASHFKRQLEREDGQLQQQRLGDLIDRQRERAATAVRVARVRIPSPREFVLGEPQRLTEVMLLSVGRAYGAVRGRAAVAMWWTPRNTWVLTQAPVHARHSAMRCQLLVVAAVRAPSGGAAAPLRGGRCCRGCRGPHGSMSTRTDRGISAPDMQ